MNIDKAGPKIVIDAEKLKKHIDGIDKKKFQAAMLVGVIHKGSFCRQHDGSTKFDERVFWGCIKCIHEIADRAFAEHLVNEGQKVCDLSEVK